MRPPKTSSTTFERVKIGEFIFGEIEKIQYDPEHSFKGFEGKADTKAPAVRFVFKLQAYEYHHFSRWMKFNLGEKSNLYGKYVSKLVANAKPDIDFDLDELVGMQVKTIWDEKGDFQNLENIWPVKGKITVKELKDEPICEEPPLPDDDFIPEIEEGDVPL